MRTWISVIVAVLLIGSGLVGVLDLQSMLRPAEKAHSGPIVDGEATVPAEVSPVKVATAPIRSRPIPVKATPIAPEAEPETIVLDDDWGGTDAPVAEAPKPAPQHPLLVKVEPVDRKADAVTVVTPQIKAPAARPVRRALTADAPPTVEVRMRHEARVSGQRVLLSHVAEVSAAPGIDIPAPNTVQVAEIGAKSTQTVQISRSAVRTALTNAGVDMNKARFSGPSVTRVLPQRNVVQSVDLMNAARNYLMTILTKEYGFKKDALKVATRQEVQPQVVPSGKVTVVPRREDERRPLGPVTVVLDVRVNGERVATARAAFDVQATQRVVVARSQVVNGNVIDTGDVIIESRDVLTLPQDVVTDTAAVVGKMARLTLAPGTILGAGMVAIAPTVARNAQVSIHYQGERVQLQMPGVALKDGQKGDTIPVRNTDTNKVLEAVVLDRSNVVVGPAPGVAMTEPASIAPVETHPQSNPVPAGVTVIAPRPAIPLHGTSRNFS